MLVAAMMGLWRKKLEFRRIKAIGEFK